MKELKNILEGLLDANLADKDIPTLDLIESAFTEFYADGMRRAFAEFQTYIVELECAKVYPPRITAALEPIIKELEQNKNFPACRYISRELNDVVGQIEKRFGHSRSDIPDYADRVLKMVTVAHELDSILNKHNKKYKKSTIDEVYARLNIRNKKVIFEISTVILDNVDKTIEAIEKHKFSGKLHSIAHQQGPDEELIITIQIP